MAVIVRPEVNMEPPKPRMVEMDDCRWVRSWIKEGHAQEVAGEILVDRHGTIRGDLADGSTFSLYSGGRAMWGKGGRDGFFLCGMGYAAKVKQQNGDPFYFFVFIGEP